MPKSTFVGIAALLSASFTINFHLLVSSVPPLVATRSKWLLNCPHESECTPDSQHRAEKTSTPPVVKPRTSGLQGRYQSNPLDHGGYFHRKTFAPEAS
ncbi:hypothetical protein M8J77_019328 [Diaphorina citri]|nr:hypothetical protein M8J77_019328 [Diaphorina citri]